MNNSERWPKFRLQIPTQDSCSSVVCVRLWEKESPGDLNFGGKLADCHGVVERAWDGGKQTCDSCTAQVLTRTAFSLVMETTKRPDFPNHVVLSTVHWMDSFFCLSGVGTLLRTVVIWEEGKEQCMEVNDWHSNFSLFLFLQKHIWGQRRRGRLCQYVDYQWSKGLIVSNALLKTESKISGNLWGFLQEAFMQANCTC